MIKLFKKYSVLVLALSFLGSMGCGGGDGGGDGTAAPAAPETPAAPTPDRPAPPVEPLEKPATTADGIATEDAEFVEGEDLPEAGQDGLAKVTLSPFSRTREGEAVITLRVEPESPPADNSASEGKFLVATDHKTIERVLFDVTLLDRECYHRRTGRVDERGIGTTEQICKEQSSYNGYFNARYLEKRGVRVSFGEAFNRWYRRNAPGGAGIDEDENNLISFRVQLQFEDGTYSNRVYSPDIVFEDLEESISEPEPGDGEGFLPQVPPQGYEGVEVCFENVSRTLCERLAVAGVTSSLLPDRRWGNVNPDFSFSPFTDEESGIEITQEQIDRLKADFERSLNPFRTTLHASGDCQHLVPPCEPVVFDIVYGEIFDSDEPLNPIALIEKYLDDEAMNCPIDNAGYIPGETEREDFWILNFWTDAQDSEHAGNNACFLRYNAPGSSEFPGTPLD